jgi:NitT/TauT family transport system ATP-binding protein
MSAAPGGIVDQIPIEGGYPRSEEFRTSQQYNERCRLVSAALRRAMTGGGTDDSAR